MPDAGQSGIYEQGMKLSEALLHLDRAEKAFEGGATEQGLIDVGRARATLQCLVDCGDSGKCLA